MRGGSTQATPLTLDTLLGDLPHSVLNHLYAWRDKTPFLNLFDALDVLCRLGLVHECDANFDMTMLTHYIDRFPEASTSPLAYFAAGDDAASGLDMADGAPPLFSTFAAAIPTLFDKQYVLNRLFVF